ncbi:MAG: DUF2059 domain-containing protein [Epsilonproteobacteria bacterium]|nr:DUF2059 domain-containing protein [Campylobacterota bacterium]
MFEFKKVIVWLVILSSLSLFVEAKNNDTSIKKGSIKENSAVEEAKKLLDEMNLKAVYKSAVNKSTQRIVQADPRFKKIESNIKAFYEKYIGWRVMREDLAKLYAKYFTPQELREITNFYKTKTGKKVLATMNKLTYEGQRLTRKKLMPHMKELQKMLDDALKEKKVAKKEGNKK